LQNKNAKIRLVIHNLTVKVSYLILDFINMHFKIDTLDQNVIHQMKKYNIWLPECPVALKDLRVVTVNHYNFDEKIIQGEIMVHMKIAQKLVDIFAELFERKFPIHSIKLIQEFEGNDILSMEANNSSAFNFRKIANTDKISLHSYGIAIDINPLQNPYIRYDNQTISIQPQASETFIDRTNVRLGMVEEIVRLFTDRGFNWGGNWSSIKDYQHFEYPLSAILDKG
jgi:hypothetical protein